MELLHQYLAAIDNVHALLWSAETLTNDVEDGSLATLVCKDVADADSRIFFFSSSGAPVL